MKNKNVIVTFLTDFKVKENILEVFTTDFHLRLLYGTNTNDNQIMERYKKLDKIIGLLIKKRLQNTVSWNFMSLVIQNSLNLAIFFIG